MRKRDAATLARSTMDAHNLYDWHFAWSRSKRQAGCCNFSNKTITLSAPYVELNTEAEVLDTILHEIAHALVGNKAGHGWVWKAKCREIGANPTRCIDGDSVVMPPMKWALVCRHCKEVRGYMGRRTDKRRSCSKCSPGGKFNADYLLELVLTEELNQEAACPR